MKLLDRLENLKYNFYEVWDETKPTRTTSGFLINTLECSSRAKYLRLSLSGLTAITPLIGLGGGFFLYSQYDLINLRKKYKTHPQGKAFVDMELENKDVEYLMIFLGELGLNYPYYNFLFN